MMGAVIRLSPSLLAVVLTASVALAAPAVSADTLFREVPSTGLPDQGKSFGAVWADLDRDGRLDFLLGHHGHGMGVYLDRGGLRLVRQDSCAWVPCQDIDQHGVAACDFNCDGTWDFYVTVGADRGQGTGPNQMWIRGNDGCYANLLPAEHTMADQHGRGRGAAWVCLDNDRFPELLVLNFQSPARLFSYDGRLWHDLSPRVNPYLAPDSPRRNFSDSRGLYFTTAGIGDLDNDGHTDLVLAGDGHFLLRNDGDGGLLDVTAAAGLPQQVTILVDIVLGDVDNDGDLDILYVFRYLGGIEIWLNESTPGRLRFVKGPDLGHLPLAPELESALLADFDNDGYLDLQLMMMDQDFTNRPNLLARGVGDGDFIDVTAPWGAQAAVEALPCGAWPVDLDRDGDPDLLLIHGKEDFPERRGVCVLHENTTDRLGVTLTLITQGGTPHGLGARVELVTPDGRQLRQVRSVLHHWNATVLPIHFGVGDAAAPYQVVVTWPQGQTQTFLLPQAGAAYELRQGGVATRLDP